MDSRRSVAPPITPTMGVLALLLNLALVSPQLPAGDDGALERGRDPWVFRLALEDKPGMLVAAMSEHLWVAYNPATAALERIWTGDMAFKGKVWDFSQSNSDAQGRLLYDDAGTILPIVTPGTDLPAGWTADGVELDDQAFRFVEENATLVSPAIDLRSVRNAMLSFHERSRRGPFLVEVSTDDGQTWDAQAFESTLHGSKDEDFQRNIRQLEVDGERVRVRFTQTDAGHAKWLREIQITADPAVWDASRVRWLGYAFERQSDGTDQLVIRSELQYDDGRRVLVEESPELVSSGAGMALERRIVLRGGGARLSFSPSGAGLEGMPRAASLGEAFGRMTLTFPSEGTYTVRHGWSR